MITYALMHGCMLAMKNQNTDLLSSAASGDLNALRKVLNDASDLSAVDKNGRSALFLAASRGHVACVTELVDHATNNNIVPVDGIKSFEIACTNGHVPSAEILSTYMEAVKGKSATELQLQFAENVHFMREEEKLAKQRAAQKNKNDMGGFHAISNRIGLVEHKKYQRQKAAIFLGDVPRLLSLFDSEKSYEVLGLIKRFKDTPGAMSACGPVIKLRDSLRAKNILDSGSFWELKGAAELCDTHGHTIKEFAKIVEDKDKNKHELDCLTEKNKQTFVVELKDYGFRGASSISNKNSEALKIQFAKQRSLIGFCPELSGCQHAVMFAKMPPKKVLCALDLAKNGSELFVHGDKK